MSTPFTELIIKAPFLFVKGFLMGFMNGRKEIFDYFFHRKSGIKRDTLLEIVKELLAIDNYTDLCIPSSIVGEFIEALGRIDPSIGVSIQQQRSIKNAEFNFSFKLYNQKHADICKQLFTFTPATVEVKNFEPEERKDDQYIGIREYAPIHPYIYHGEGTVYGEFEGVMNFYLTIKRSDLSDQILCNEITLHFE